MHAIWHRAFEHDLLLVVFPFQCHHGDFLFVEAGPASAGWTIYPPLSALPQAIPGSGAGMTLWLVSMAIFIASSLLGALNYIVTVLNLRTKGMSMTRLPLTIWAFFITAVIGVVSFPVLLSAALLLIMDRSFGTSFFLSDIYIAGKYCTIKEVLQYCSSTYSGSWDTQRFTSFCCPPWELLLKSLLPIRETHIWVSGHGGLHISHCFPINHCVGHHMFVSGMNPFWDRYLLLLPYWLPYLRL